jgi:hypothetical protein
MIETLGAMCGSRGARSEFGRGNYKENTDKTGL